MRCPVCGQEDQHGAFCAGCGTALPLETDVAPPLAPEPLSQPAAPQPSSQQAPPQPMHSQQPPPPMQAPYPDPALYAQPAAPPPKKKRGCLKGCLLTFLVILLVGLVVCGWLFQWPQKLGLVASPAEKVFGQDMDPFADAILMTEIEEAGFDSTGAYLYVVPATEREGMLAHFVLDESQGFAWSGEYASPVESLMVLVSTSAAASDLDIRIVGVDYRDSIGDEVVVMTAPIDVTSDYAHGIVSRDEWLSTIEGRSTLSQLIESQLGWLQ